MEVLKVFVSGIIVIGVATAVFSRGPNTAKVLRAAGDASSGLLHTAEKG